MAFDPPVLSSEYSFESLTVFNELSSTVIVVDFSLEQGAKLVWANSAARDVNNGMSLEEMLELDVSWKAQDGSNLNDLLKTKVQKNHEVHKIRVKIGFKKAVGGEKLMDCAFRPLRLRGNIAVEVAPCLARVYALSARHQPGRLVRNPSTVGGKDRDDAILVRPNRTEAELHVHAPPRNIKSRSGARTAP